MKLATLREGTRAGTLIVASRGGRTAARVTDIAPTLQAAPEAWDSVEVPLQDLHAAPNAGEAAGAFPVDPAELMAPLPRTYVRIEMRDVAGDSLFGAIEQKVVRREA